MKGKEKRRNRKERKGKGRDGRRKRKGMFSLIYWEAEAVFWGWDGMG